MPELVTDPDILGQLNAPDPVAAPATAAVPPAAAPASASSAPSPGTPVTDPDLLNQLNAPDPSEQPVYSGSLLPFSRYADGHVGFDSNAGIVGALTRPFKMAGAVATGQLDPTSPEGIAAATDAAMTYSPMSALARAGTAGATLSPTRAATARDLPAPTADALKAAGGAGFTQARGLGVDYDPAAVASMADGVRQTLGDRGIVDRLAPNVHGILNDLASPPAGATAVPFGGLDAARKAFGAAGQNFTNPTEQRAAGIAQDAIDKFVMAADPNTVVSGPADQVSSLVSGARANYAAAMRAQQLGDLADSATRRAAASNSGQNIGNTLRQRAASLLDSAKSSGGFTDDELGQLDTLARGTIPQNLTRNASNWLGGGGGLGATIAAGIGATVLGPKGLALPAIGQGLKGMSNSMTSSMLDKIIAGTAKRSPLFTSQLPGAMVQTTNMNPIDLAGSATPILSRILAANGLNNGAPQ